MLACSFLGLDQIEVVGAIFILTFGSFPIYLYFRNVRWEKKFLQKAAKILRKDLPEVEVNEPYFAKEDWWALCRFIGEKEATQLKMRIPMQVRVEFEFDIKVPLFSLRPRGRGAAFLKRSAAPEVVIGDVGFDRAQIVQSVSVDFAKKVLSPINRELLGEMKKLDRIGVLQVEAFGHTAAITFHDFIPGVKELVPFLKGAFTFADRLVSIAEREQKKSADSCSVCGEVLFKKLVNCSRCQKAYHRSCWTYWGSCFARDCDETKSVEGRG
ncbi:MAG: RING finger protein [Planctomycetota bacterium]|nr:RING finger protein [Planctomycetota bacterium]